MESSVGMLVHQVQPLEVDRADIEAPAIEPPAMGQSRLV